MGLTRIRAEQISDIDYKQAVRVITLTDITLSGGAPAEVDGVSLVAGDRVLVNGQSDAAQNGLYRVQTVGAGSNGTWVRTTDGNEDGEIQPGMVVMVTQGTQYADTPWKLTTNGEIEIGVTELTFEENYSLAFGNIFANGTAVIANVVSAAITFEAGNNVSITGNNTTKTVTFAVTGITTSRIANGTSNVDIATANGNVTTTVNGNTTLTVTDLGANIAGYVTVTGNITGGNLLPPTDNTGVVGTAALTWSDGQFHNFTVDGALQVNGTITLDDNDVLRIGTGLDWNLYHDGTDNYMDLIVGDILIRDTSTKSPTTQFTFGRTTGNFTATGNVTGGNLITAGLVSLSSITKTGSNGVGNIGSSTSVFNTVFAKATSAQYADLAEMYEADAVYEPGTVLCFGGSKEVTLCGQADSTRVAGVVSTNPSYLMNSGQTGDNVVAVALTGRVPCKVTGTIRKGDLMVAAGDGRARANNAAAVGTVIGKALADFDGSDGMIEVVVGRV